MQSYGYFGDANPGGHSLKKKTARVGGTKVPIEKHQRNTRPGPICFKTLPKPMPAAEMPRAKEEGRE